MLQEVKKSRASRVVVAAAVVAFGALSVTATPSVAEDQGARDPNGFYIMGADPWAILIFPVKMLSRIITLPIGAFQIPDDYEMQ